MSIEEITANAYAVFQQAGGYSIDPGSILPADVPLELSGEAVRSRLCIFTDQRGNELAMRPDLTLPVAMLEAQGRQMGRGGEMVYHYAARAFRLPTTPQDPMEFPQVGFEHFGADSTPEIDADVFARVLDAAEAAGAPVTRVSLGDLSVFPAFIDALGLGDAQGGLLKRAFRQAGGASQLLSQAPPHPEAELASQVEGAPPEAREEIVLDALDKRDIELVGARTISEIAAGLAGQAQIAKLGGVPAEARELLKAVLQVDGEPSEAIADLAELATDAGLDGLGELFDRLRTRTRLMTNRGGELINSATFQTPFGRRFNYYDGFVFELFGAGADDRRPLASGGRYDGLLAGLGGANAAATAVGGVVRPDRILMARETNA